MSRPTITGATEPRFVDTAGARVCTQAFGNAGDPAIVLIHGACASMLWWPEPFCRLLASQGRLVIRFDNRDTGLSTMSPPGAPDYTLTDLAADVVAILDAYGVERASLDGPWRAAPRWCWASTTPSGSIP